MMRRVTGAPATDPKLHGHKRPERRLLNAVLIVGILDALLLVVLLYFAFVDRSDSAVSVLGPIHGIGYLLLVGLTARGAIDDQWGFWFPALVVVTGGPIGSFVGEIVLRPRLRD
jgi:integral membrane protein